MADSNKAKYPALRIIAAWNKAFGYIVGALIALSGFIALFNDGSTGFAIGMIIGAVVFIIVSVAFAEIIQVFLDTEHNTRNSADYLAEIVKMKSMAGEKRPIPSPTQNLSSAKQTAPAKKASAQQAETIRSLIWDLHADGMTPDDIAGELKAEGMPTLDGSPKWTATVVENVLTQT